MKRNIFYFPLEPVKSRYTYQLSSSWMPDSLSKFDWNIVVIDGELQQEKDIKVGHVLDSIGRSVFSFSQMSNFLKNHLDKGIVKNDDILFFQDFWTPGVEAIYYALDLHHIKVKTYSQVWAQSVDEYDFTYSMRHWMRPFELGFDKVHNGIFVASSVHKEQLKSSGFNSPVHVMSLPVDISQVTAMVDKVKKKKQVLFSSRMNSEKNPLFMMKTAEEFLKRNKDYTWVCTTSSPEFRSEDPFILEQLNSLSQREPRFILKNNLSKKEYYEIISESEVQFNSSLQDYVAFTMIEATSFDCKLVYPEFRSFPECILDKNYLYSPFILDDAVQVLEKVISMKTSSLQSKVLDITNLGRLFESYIMFNDIEKEFNIWLEYDLISGKYNAK